MAIPSSVVAGRPATLAGVVQSSSVLNATPNYPFFLVHHTNAEGSWNVETEGLDRPTWLPVVSRVPIMPGAANHRTRQADEGVAASYQLAHNNLEAAGAIILKHDLKCGGVDSYMYQTDCQARDAEGRVGASGAYYYEAWCTPEQPILGARAKDRLDRAAYNRWRLALVEEGHVPPPNPRVIGKALADERRRHANAEGRTYTTEEGRERKLGAAASRFELHEKAVVPQRRERASAATPNDPEPKSRSRKPSDG